MRKKRTNKFLITSLIMLTVMLCSAASVFGADLSESNYRATDRFKWDFYQNSAVKDSSLVSVKVGDTILGATGASTTGSAVSEKVSVEIAAGYRIVAYKIVCGDKYSCRTDSTGHATKVTFSDGDYRSALNLSPAKADFGHSSKKDPYYLLLDVVKVSEVYDVTYVLGSAGAVDFASATVPAGEKDQPYNTLITVKEAGATAEDSAGAAQYEFDGWLISDEAESYAEGSKIAAGAKFNIMSDTTLTATWKLKQYKVSYAYSGKTPEGAPELPAEANYEFGASVDVNAPAELSDYVFSGWKTSDAAVESGSFTMPGKNVTFSGSFTKVPASYSVTYVYDESSPEGAPAVPAKKSYKAGETVTIAASPVTDGFEFTGWETPVQVKNGEFTMPEKDITVIGGWRAVAVKYELKFIYEGNVPKSGAALPDVTLREANETITLPSVAAVSGYEFSGWTCEEAELGKTSFLMPEKDTVVKGVWRKISDAPKTGDSVFLLIATPVLLTALGVLCRAVYLKKKLSD